MISQLLAGNLCKANYLGWLDVWKTEQDYILPLIGKKKRQQT